MQLLWIKFGTFCGRKEVIWPPGESLGLFLAKNGFYFDILCNTFLVYIVARCRLHLSIQYLTINFVKKSFFIKLNTLLLKMKKIKSTLYSWTLSPYLISFMNNPSSLTLIHCSSSYETKIFTFTIPCLSNISLSWTLNSY